MIANASAQIGGGRREDRRFLTGGGRYTGDLQPEGLLYMALVRAPHAHARILSIDSAEATAMPGVQAVITAADLDAAGVKPEGLGVSSPLADGSDGPKPKRHALAQDKVMYLGEPVAAVIAATRAEARDAAEAVMVDYEALEALASRAEATAPDAPQLLDGAPGNVGFVWRGGDAAAAEAALAGSAHVTRLTLTVSRTNAATMEPRLFLAEIGPDGEVVMHASHQGPHGLRDALRGRGFDGARAELGDVGGSFGMKGGLHIEGVVTAQAARQLGRPVLWEADRSDAFLADPPGRDTEAEVALGFDAEGRITACTAKVSSNIGGHLNGGGGAIMNIGSIAGAYDIPAMSAEVWGILTNTIPLTAYRGAGRPEAAYYIERTLDVAAAELGIPPLELRKRNLIAPEKMPYKTALVFTYDCGDFPQLVATGSRVADLDGFPARKADAEARGKLLGLGIGLCIETAAGPFGSARPDNARLGLLADGRLVLAPGSFSVGQGHETAFPRLVAQRLGIDASQVLHRQGDSQDPMTGRDNGGSGSLAVGGPAVVDATEKMVTHLRQMVAERLGIDQAALGWEDGLMREEGTNRSFTLADIAAMLGEEGVVAEVDGAFQPSETTFPNGMHVAEVEVDPATGERRLTRYAAVEDLGAVLNPEFVAGQLHGGVMQGVGQALGEAVVYDEDGQLLSGSFMDYAVPRAMDGVQMVVDFANVPTAINPLGVKGVGEAGTVGALSAVMNAVNDALVGRGVRHLDMPATPGRIWAALQAAG